MRRADPIDVLFSLFVCKDAWGMTRELNVCIHQKRQKATANCCFDLMYVFIICHGRGWRRNQRTPWLTYEHANTTTFLLLELVQVILLRCISKLSCMKQYLKFCPLNSFLLYLYSICQETTEIHAFCRIYVGNVTYLINHVIVLKD